jgi:flagellar hook-associated protein 1
MSLTLALNNALSGLNVSQTAMGVLSNNIANANTEGYSRQVAVLSPQVTGSQGAGVRVEEIVRKIDEYLNRATRSQTSEVSQAATVSDYMSRIQVMMGEPGGSNSLDEYIENFFNVLQSLAETPELSSYRSQAVNAGRILADELSTLAQGLEDLRYQADSDIKDGLDLVNGEIMRLYETNQAIYRAQALAEPTSNLLDQRDAILSTIADHVDIKVNQLDSGEVYVYTSAGLPLLEYMPYQFQYNSVSSINTFTSDGTLGSITLDGVGEDGEFIGRPQTVVSAGVEGEITTSLRSGKIKALLDLRDQEIPDILSQLDLISSRLRDEVNALHNTGSGLPAASTLTGDRLVGYEDASEWSGTVRIAVLNEDGSAPDSYYDNTESGHLALDLDLDALRGQFGDLLTTQNIMDEINAYFQPQNNAVVNNMQDISIASLSNTVPDVGNTYSFDFQLENISSTNSNFWVTDLQVLDDTAAVIDTQNLAAANTVNLNATNTFETVTGSNLVTVNATGHGYQNGDVVYMNGVVGTVGGIPAAEFNGQAFRVVNATANSFQIELVSDATIDAPVPGPQIDMAGVTALSADATQLPGSVSRTGGSGYTVDLSAAPASAYYTVQATVMVEDDEGNLVATTVDYRINNNVTDTINKRHAATSIGAGGTIEVPNSHRALLKAQLVDEEGNIASADEKGYLQLVGQEIPGEPGQSYTIAIDELTSQHLGRPNDNPAVPGTERGFSHYFGLNNFFTSNELTGTGDTVDGSALSLAVRQDILDNPNLISMGSLTQTPSTPVDGEAPDYSYERTSGDNSIAQLMAKLGLEQQSFEAAGGLPSTNKTFNGYASEVLGYTASSAATATSRLSDQQTLMDGFQAQKDAVSGVNIDEEMANTIIFQNSYAASAQVINVVKELFDTLLAAF